MEMREALAISIDAILGDGVGEEEIQDIWSWLTPPAEARLLLSFIQDAIRRMSEAEEEIEVRIYAEELALYSHALCDVIFRPMEL
jgi:hypothetical protein